MSQIEKIADIIMRNRLIAVKEADSVAAEIIDTLQPDVSGLVEALEKYLVGYLSNLKARNGEIKPEVIAKATVEFVKNLSTYREGKQWLDEPPSEPGLYWWRKKKQHSSRACIAYNMRSNGRNIMQVRFFGTADGLTAADIKGQWYGPIHPPKGEE